MEIGTFTLAFLFLLLYLVCVYASILRYCQAIMFLPVVKKLAEDCCKYGNNNQNLGFVLGRASVEFGKSHSQMEIEREKLLRVLGEQVRAIPILSFTIS